LSALPWLPSKPTEFRQKVRDLHNSAQPGAAAQALASCDLDDTAAGQLSRAIRTVRQSGVSLAPLSPFRLGVLANATFDLVVDILPAAAARHGVDLDIVLAPYDQVMQEALDPASTVNAARCDAVLFAIDHRWLGLDRPRLADGAGAAAVDEAFARLSAAADAVRAQGATPIVPLLAAPAEALFGHIDRRISGAPRAMISALNERTIRYAAETGAYLLDVAALAERVGVENWFSPVQWNLYKLPFSSACNAVYADAVGRILGAVRGKARKCLVLDLDNTLWGGVVGDDGVEGLKIGEGSPEGEAHLAVQRLALQLRDRGVMLAVCSKNFDETARRPFRELPDMLIRESDIAVFQANWIDKASNLEAIAKTLNIGVDALVLLDDNPAERAQVRAALPMVAVPELPADPSFFAPYLAASGLFEAVSFSQEDLIRAGSYAADAKRAEVMAQTRDLGDYLAALDMWISFAPFDAVGRARIAQLINKSNQFNLTTRRYTEAEVEAAERDPSVYTLQVRLGDKFGDFGMIGVVIARPHTESGKPAWDIDSWLMSCRVLGRKVEEAMLAEIARAALAVGIQYLAGSYAPTSKNGMVKDHYAKLGFAMTEETDAGARRFLLNLSAWEPPSLPHSIRVSPSGAALQEA
jgi:FkbH-like protein